MQMNPCHTYNTIKMLFSFGYRNTDFMSRKKIFQLLFTAKTYKLLHYKLLFSNVQLCTYYVNCIQVLRTPLRVPNLQCMRTIRA